MKKGKGADTAPDGGRNPYKGGGKKKAALKASAPVQQDDPRLLVPGLVLVKDFISKEEEEQLTQAVEEREWDLDLKRKVQQYGYRFEHNAQNLRGGYLGPLPDFAQQVTARLVSTGLMPYEPDQMIINHYTPGQGIHPHVDKTHCFEGVVGSLGLGSSCIMEFKHIETGRRVDVFFERRTALMLTGEARYGWTHGISAVVSDTWKGVQFKRKNRISLTWRKVILPPAKSDGEPRPQPTNDDSAHIDEQQATA